METEYPIEMDWTATLQRIDTGTEHRVNVRATDILAAAAEAKIKADQRFSRAIGVEVLR